MPKHPQNLVEALEQHQHAPSHRGFRFIRTDGTEQFFAYRDLRQEAHRRAAYFRSLGLQVDDRVALVLADNTEFVLSFLGAVCAGLVPVPIYPRASFKAIDNYQETVAHIAKSADAKIALTLAETLPFIEPLKDRGLQVVTMDHASLETDAVKATHPKGDSLCFLQYTSGSTAKPKGVMVTHDNLATNAYAFLGPAGIDKNEDDLGVSWLPLYHDMGLIGYVLGTLLYDLPVILMPTAMFARRPLRWLETVSRHKASVIYAPNFGYELATKRAKASDVEAFDLHAVRVAGCGAEPIRAQTLKAFADKFAPSGFKTKAFLPSYGLAESTLAVTFHPQDTPLLIDRIDAEALSGGYAEPAAKTEEHTLELVSCGKPFPNHALRIATESGESLKERQVGEVQVKGPSVTPGYLADPEATQTSRFDGWLRTGDLGYLSDGNLFICGRMKDLIILRGANYYPQDLEWSVSELPLLSRRRAVAFAADLLEGEKLVLVVEGARQDAQQIEDLVKQRVQATSGIAVHDVVVVKPGSIPLTSSGKPQRHKLRSMYEAGELRP